MRRILGFSSKKQGGKTTAVRCVLEALPQYGPTAPLVVSFAQPLKDIVNRCFVPGSPLRMESEEDKATVLPCGKTVREVLQIVGTDWFRSLWPDCWVNAFRRAVEVSTCENILVPDVRFPNELAAIQQMGGHVVRFLRAPFAGQDQHASETALDDVAVPLRFDALIDNRDMTIPQQNEAVLALVRERGWMRF